MKELNEHTVSFLYILWLKGGKEKEVAKKVGISRSTVYKYFLNFRQNKNTLQGHYSLHSGNYQYYEREEEIFKSINPEYNPEDLQGWELEQFLKDKTPKDKKL
jgi:transposase